MSYLVLRMRAIPFLPVSRSTMLRKSLRVQILSLLGGSLVAMLLIALVCFQFCRPACAVMPSWWTGRCGLRN